MRKSIISLIILTGLYSGSFAQNKNYMDEYAAGYRGGFIKGIKTPKNSLNFIALGSWGRNGEYFQKEVANQLSNAAVSIDADFFISTGDNIYPNGVASVNDPLWKASFEDIYKQYSLQKDWYSVLGNHEYRGNIDAVIEYTNVSRRWNVPARYYSKKFWIDDDSTRQVLIVFIDTDPFIKGYYTNPEYRDEVSRQDTTAQKKWLEGVLGDNSPNIKWKIVVGHHPAYTSGKRMENDATLAIRNSFKSLFDKYKVDIYLSGHERQLEHDKPEGNTDYFISGAGSKVRPVGKLLPGIGKFTVSTCGFMTFSINAEKILVQTIDYKGNIIYSTTITKGIK